MKKLILYMAITLFTFVSYAQPPSSEMPVGSVLAWAGNRAMLPAGWLVCDGSQISKDNYPKLCSVLGNSWGPTDVEASVARLFYLPDLRGVFLRGVNESRKDKYADMDADNRHYKIQEEPSNFQSNQVGSFQNDQFKEHSHKLKVSGSNYSNGGYNAESNQNTNIHETSMEGGSETRPKNAYVYWIIKAG